MDNHPVDLVFDDIADFKDIYGSDPLLNDMEERSSDDFVFDMDADNVDLGPRTSENGIESITGSDLSSPFSSPYHNDGPLILTEADVAALVPPSFEDTNFLANVKAEFPPSFIEVMESSGVDGADAPTTLPNTTAKPKLVGKKRGRPKKMPKENESKDISAVLLTEEELLKLDSQRYEDEITKLKAMRSLTFAEEECIKAQRRRIKNRESAHNSRERKRQATDDLSSHIHILEQENTSLRAQLSAVTAENQALKDQLQRIVKGGQRNTSPPSRARPTKRAASAATVLVVLFCFGLFFQQGQDAGDQHMSSYSTRAILEIPDERVSIRSLPTTSPEGNCSRSEAPREVGAQEQCRSTASQVARWVGDGKQTPPKIEAKEVAVYRPLDEVSGRTSDVSRVFNNESEPLEIPYNDLWECGLKRRTNTHYYAVSKLEQIFPPDTVENVSGEKYKMSFIIPSSSLPSRPTNSGEPTVVEIHTEVLDISFIRTSTQRAEEPPTTNSIPPVAL